MQNPGEVRMRSINDDSRWDSNSTLPADAGVLLLNYAIYASVVRLIRRTGGACGTRTRHLNDAIVALSQMS